MKNNERHVVSLHANENFYGCSPSVFRAIREDIRKVHLYPAVPVRLEERLAEKFGVNQNSIVVGAGSVRLIDGIIQALVEPDEEIIIFEQSFVAYEQLAKAHRRKYKLAKQNDFTCDMQNIFPLITIKTKVIFIANPNNPTGTIITHKQLEYLLENISKKILVVIDEAYGEYVTDISFPDSISLQRKYSNLVILRTFSKIYGLSGLRIGYAIAEESISNTLKKSRIPFFFNSLSEDAALSALEDQKFIASCAKKNAREREWLYEKLKQTGFHVLPSQGNFIFISFLDEKEKESIYAKLIHAGIMICNLKIFGQDKSLRIGIGDNKTNIQIYSCLK